MAHGVDWDGQVAGRAAAKLRGPPVGLVTADQRASRPGLASRASAVELLLVTAILPATRPISTVSCSSTACRVLARSRPRTESGWLSAACFACLAASAWNSPISCASSPLTREFIRLTSGHQRPPPSLHGTSVGQEALGTVVCVTGPSGSGKSTLLSLLVRLAEPQSGRIEVDGRDISGIPLPALRELITLVPQDPWLYAGTIADNIGYGRFGATSAQIAKAAEHAGVAAFARDLPLGLQTPVGEDGTQLSGGQQRRVAVARALLAGTPMLLLDEPTTGLDPATESRLIDDLLAVTRGKTLVMVTHQPRLTDRADQVIRVDGGRITPACIPAAARRPAAVPA